MFRFALQPLLDRRQCELEAAQARAAAAERNLLQAQRACGDLERRLRLPLRGGESQAIALLLDQQQRRIAVALTERAARRRELAAAWSAFCVMDSLRQNAMVAYRAAQRRREEADIEESNALGRAAALRGFVAVAALHGN